MTITAPLPSASTQQEGPVKPRRSTNKWRPQLWSAPVMAAPATVIVIGLFLVPLLILIAYSFLTAGMFSVSQPFTMSNYVDALQNKATTTLGKNSLIIGLSAATVSLVAGVPIAYWLRYYAKRRGNIVLFLITSSMFASYLVRIYAWRSILGSNGLLNNGLQAMGLIHQPLQFFLYSRVAVVLALVHIFLPYVVLVLYAGLRPIRPEYFEAARDLGAGAVRRWTRVVLPLIAPQLATSWIFVFILAAGDYVTPQFLGGTNGSMIGVLIQQDFNVNGNWAGGGAISLLMLLAFAGAYAVMMGALRITGLSRVQFD